MNIVERSEILQKIAFAVAAEGAAQHRVWQLNGQAKEM